MSAEGNSFLSDLTAAIQTDIPKKRHAAVLHDIVESTREFLVSVDPHNLRAEEIATLLESPPLLEVRRARHEI